jgi:uracil-DNA glycosylase family 4
VEGALMAFGSLFDDIAVEETKPSKKVRKTREPDPNKPAKPKKVKTQKEDQRGCEFCPLNEVKGIKKILGEVTGKDLAIFAQSPGPDENEEGRELVGESGRWFWRELKKVGLHREDFDLQNSVRCFPAEWSEGSYNSYLKMRSPSAKEIKCCSLHTDNALTKLKARQILVLGQVAAKALLNTRSLPLQKIFWDERLNARIYLVDHPAFFVRGVSAERLKAFREILAVFAKDRQRDNISMSDQFSYVKQLDIRLVLNEEQALEAEKVIREHALAGHRSGVDIEDDEVEGKHIITACGFAPTKNLAYVFVFWHLEQSRGDGGAVKAVAKRILEDPLIKQAYHYGCTDVTKLLELEGIRVPTEAYDHDTNCSEYIRFPDKRAYGLEAIAESRFPEFSGYKNIIIPDLIAAAKDVPPSIQRAPLDAQAKYVKKKGLMKVAVLPLEKLRVYNGTDCILTKRIEVSNKKYVPQALLKLYIDLNHILYRMEPNGPLFDYEQQAKLEAVYPWKANKHLARMREIIGDPKFNPGSHPQVYNAIYSTLQLECPFDGKPNTRKGTLDMLAGVHEFPRLVIEWRQFSKALGTYIEGYKKCADAWNGRLRTKWWSTGTRTGRLSSGGKKSDESGKVVNLQNIHGDAQLQNMMVADQNWRRVYRKTRKLLKTYGLDVLAFWEKQDEYEKALAKAKKSNKPCKLEKPIASSEVTEQISLISQKVERWLEREMPEARVFLQLDYGQVEVRVMAQLSGDENLIADCQEADIHTTVGSRMTGWDPEKIRNDKLTRTRTKNIHFGICFGQSEEGTVRYVFQMSPPGERGKISEEDIRKAYRRYFKRYSGVKQFISHQREFGKENRYVSTLFGMHQPLEIHGEKESDQEYVGDGEGKRGSWWGNQAINGPVQGTAHQLLVCGLVNVLRQPEKYAVLGGVPVMDVHDAIYFNVRLLDLVEAYERARYLMEQESLATVKSDFPNIDWKVPIVTEAEAGLSLGCRVELEDGKFTVGSFLLDWSRKRRKQLIALDEELTEVTVSVEETSIVTGA